MTGPPPGCSAHVLVLMCGLWDPRPHGDGWAVRMAQLRASLPKRGITAKTEQHSHFGELHTTPTVTFTDAIRPPGLVWAEVVYLWFGWKL